MVDFRAAGLAAAVLAISTGSVGGTTNCCGKLDGCCSQPSTSILASNYDQPGSETHRAVYDPRCCSPYFGIENADVVCGAPGPYEVAGCRFCRDVCDADDTACVPCSTTLVAGEGDFGPPPSRDWDKMFRPFDSASAKEDMWIFESLVRGGWSYDFDDMIGSNSYDFDDDDHDSSDDGDSNDSSDDISDADPSDHYYDDDFDGDDHTTSTYGGDGAYEDDYDCSSCEVESMPELNQRLLTQRSRSMVCDKSCLTGGHAEYGVTLCNYFNAGKECRACCQEDHMVEGCRPCGGQGCCSFCKNKIHELCKESPCSVECQAYLCCAAGWSDDDDCDHEISLITDVVASLARNTCSVSFTCDSIDLQCSDTAKECDAKGTSSRRLHKKGNERCSVVTVENAGSFDTEYASTGTFHNEHTFMAVGSRHATFALQSIAFDACSGAETLPSVSAPIMNTIVARSSSGSLTMDDGTEPHPHALNTGVGCARHVWLLHDTSGSESYAYVTVDQSQHPRFITSDWVQVRSSGDMHRVDLKLHCTPQKGHKSRQAGRF